MFGLRVISILVTCLLVSCGAENIKLPDFSSETPYDFSKDWGDRKVAVLYPNEIIVDAGARSEYMELQDELEATRDSLITENNRYHSEDPGVQRRALILKEMEAGGYLQIMLAGQLGSDFAVNSFLKLPDRVYPIPRRSDGSEKDLVEISEAYGVDFVVNISTAYIFKVDDIIRVSMTVQVFNESTGHIEREWKVSSSGLENCWTYYGDAYGYFGLKKAFHNLAGIARSLASNYIVSQYEGVVMDHELFEKRSEIWNERYYQQPVDPEVKLLLEKQRPDIAMTGYYHGLFNDDRTKMLAFFLVEMDDEYYDQHMEIPKKHATLIDDHIQVNCKCVTGRKLSGIWYFNEGFDTQVFGTDFAEERKDYFMGFAYTDLILGDEEDTVFDIWSTDEFD
jgi:hypothetical protein